MYIYIFVCELLFTLRGILRLEILSVSRNRYHSGKNIVRWTMVTRSGRFYNNNPTNFVFYIEILLIYRILVVCDFRLFICIQEGSK